MSIELVQRNLKAVLDVIAETISTSTALSSKKCRLVAVGKTKPSDMIVACYDAGQRHFGENYVQELVEKSELLKDRCSEIKWHFIGQIQSNKIGKICSCPGLYCVETIENEKHAIMFDKEWTKKRINDNKLCVYVQVNTSEEDNKGGISPDEAPKLAQFIKEKCTSLEFNGFMTIGSFNNSHSDGPNPDFNKLQEVRKKWSQDSNEPEDSIELSMGMSDDFIKAIQQGSTNVRVGSKIFGAREYKK